MIPTISDFLSVPLLVTAVGRKPLGRNEAFRQAKGLVTSHPCAYLSRHDLFALSRMTPHACRVFAFVPSRGGTPVVVLHRETHLLWFFFSVLREQCYFSTDALDILAHRHLRPLLPLILDGTLRCTEDITGKLAERFFDGKSLSLKDFMSIASLTLRLLFSEDCLTGTISDEEALLVHPIEAFTALGRLMPLLADTRIEKETPPPVSLLIKGDALLFSLHGEELPITGLRLPTGVEAVAPYAYRDTEAQIALLLALLCETVLPLPHKIYQVIT